MRGLLLVATLCAGCNFAVDGLDGQPPGSPAPSGPNAPSGPSGPSVPGVDGGVVVTVHDGGVTSVATDLATVPVGAPCANDGECGGMLCVQTVSGVVFPGGYCSMACAGGCTATSACGDVGDSQLCLASCTATSCRAGYVCCPGHATCAPVGACTN
jgi:hypothetical protein